MVEIREPITVEEAVAKVMKYRQEGEKEVISFYDSDNRRLAEPIYATDHVPSFDKSPYDGFSLRSIDTINASKKNPVQLKVVEHIGAGELPTKALQPMEATRIMTGAKIPEGADSVVMFEKCDIIEENGESFIQIYMPIEKDENIIKEGSEVKKGTKLLDEGIVVTPGVKALLATFGYDQVNVAKKPTIGVIATGTELLDVEDELEPGKIRNSNAYTICSQIKRAGANYKYFGKLADELEPSFNKIKEVLDDVDMLITTGGVSVGDFDLMPAIYEKLNAKVLFNKVAMRPGSVTTVAVLGNKLLFGLSGNPSACYVGFELFTRPIIQHYLFNKKPYLKRIKAILAEDFPKGNSFTRFVRSYLSYDHGTVNVHLAGIDKSNVVTSLAKTNCLMELPKGTKGFDKGSVVEVLLLEDIEGQSAF